MAKLKQEQKNQELGVMEKVGARGYVEMIRLALKKQLDSKSLNSKEVSVLVDSVGVDDSNSKALVKRVVAGKDVLLDYAKDRKLKFMQGEIYEGNVSDKTSTDLNPSKVVKLLKKQGKMNLFDEVFSVRKTEFQLYLGKDLMEKVGEVTTEKFASLSLNPQAGKEK